MGGGGSFTDFGPAPLTSSRTGAEGGTDGRGRPANLSAPSGGRASAGRLAGRTSGGNLCFGLAGLGAEGRGRGSAKLGPPPGPPACSGSAAAPDTPGAPGASGALVAAGSTPTCAGSALRTFSSLTLRPSDRDTAAQPIPRKTRGRERCARRRLDDIPVQRSPKLASLARRALARRIGSRATWPGEAR